VLIVSSRALDAELGRTVLWRADIERVFARDADAALETARSAAPSLTVVDASDRETALALIRRLRQDTAIHSTAIVALTRAPGADDEEAFRGAGANLVLAGPVSPVLWDVRLGELLSIPPRRELRVPVLLELWVVGPEQEPLAGLGLNISVHGMLVETERPLEVGCKLDLAFGLPGRPEELRVVGQVVRDAGFADGRWRGGGSSWCWAAAPGAHRPVRPGGALARP
jgi:CheY-like chemotaxis protein